MGSGKESGCPKERGRTVLGHVSGETAPSAWATNTGTPRPWFGSSPNEQGRDRDRILAGVGEAFRSHAALPRTGPKCL